ncbi:LIM domain-containing protein A [Ceratitis capitata]|uniref:LIM domain-containing protein A n=1 Tax=Ceratitis capitata TaxID=7213 RepID=UPI0003297A50|nr:LIM domain-containing protein A [Ceratitis capitata]XP_004523825.1 LIM domain-containing protein A [Ceratitis capitata]XP_004523826.1 LIM domain-containing protein A [Ceratitis capitata]XP_012156375.1 LIM domain-containing protein A [Ceratitis capitata]XP_012156376.1 LIM domain-containing protein A [Ceratitis capitata]XP_012156377.1 LIM domain-containing protein A [Ceratitis capitata]XP_012156378.1 LIM domain-containing protein A [Ceratitis capitata]XP_012156379.1 LIM domain-containing pr
MYSQPTYALVTCLISICTAIRVDFNTNKGPIIPPTPRTTIRPVAPFREPAPVWEDQSNDILNPNPYTYILPPPARPRPTANGNNFANAGQRPLHYYGNLLLPSNANAGQFTGQGSANMGGGSLAAKYVPNVGIRYTAVVASSSSYDNNSNNNNNNYYKNQQVNRNNGAGNYFDVNNKLPGKYYNAKTKKFKAYEKVKYVPQNYSPLIQELALPNEKPYTSVFNQDQLIRTQQLPRPDAPIAFLPTKIVATEATAKLTTSESAPTPTIARTTTSAKSTIAAESKLAHEKDSPLSKSKSLHPSKSHLKLPNISTSTQTAATASAGAHTANAISGAKSR